MPKVTASTRASKLETTIRRQARTEHVARVDAAFASSMQIAAANDGALRLLNDSRLQLIKAGQRAAEDAALDALLDAKDPVTAPISLDALYNPVQVRIAANGERLPDTATEFAAVLLPQFDLLYTTQTWKAGNWKQAVELGAAVDLFDGKGEWKLWDDVEATLTIDRSREGPAVLPAFVGCTPTDDWYWTRRVRASSPSGFAICVDLSHGSVYWHNQRHAGRVRAVRRVRASQF